MRRRSPLDPVSSSTLIVFFLTINPLLTSLVGSLSPIWCDLALIWFFFFKFSRLFDLIDNIPKLEFRELPIFVSKIFIMAMTAVTLPVLKFLINFLLALMISKAVLVALIGWVSLDVELMPVGLSNLKRLSKCVLRLLYPLSYSLLELLLDGSRKRFLEDFFDLDFLSFFLSFSSFSVRYAICPESPPPFFQGFFARSKSLWDLSVSLPSLSNLQQLLVLWVWKGPFTSLHHLQYLAVRAFLGAGPP